jgi:cellulose synthase/poly-beta-1,6-N-acetylglucosamine synthase-like glycosyltransferase
MEITSKSNISQALAADVDPHTLSYKVPGISAWTLLLSFCFMVIAFPVQALFVARVMAIYMLLRFAVVGVYYIISLVRIRWTQNYFARHGVYGGLTAEQEERCGRIRHVVIIPNYKEPLDVLARTLEALAQSPLALRQIVPVLAMEESDLDAHAVAGQLVARFEKCFVHILVTYHPSGVPGEVPGKAANQGWAARQARDQLVDQLGWKLEDMTVTSCDADSVLHQNYFGVLTRMYVLSKQPYNTIWQSPLFFDLNIWHTSASVRLLTFFNNAIQISELANPFSLPFPLSTYSLSYRLLVEVDYWDPAVISEDWHMYLRCFFARAGKMEMEAIFLPTLGEPVVGKNTWESWVNFYKQQLRHAWGASDMSYMLQQWNRNPGTPFLKKFGRIAKIWHDNMVFSTGAIIILLGSLLSINLESNPVLTIPTNTPYTTAFAVINAVGVAFTMLIWLVERIRCSDHNLSWKFITIISELGSWVIFAVVTLVLAGLPVIQAQTMMLFGGNLVYERTPKGIPQQTK